MSVNRLLGLDRLESSKTALSASGGFMICPLVWQPPLAGPMPLLQQVYQLALEQAQAAARKSRWNRCYTVSLN
jgi:hypothetical protein